MVTKYIIRCFLTITLFGTISCIRNNCDSHFAFEIPVFINGIKDSYQVGDTLNISMQINTNLIYDTISKNYFKIDTFNPFLTVSMPIIDTFPIVEGLTSNSLLSIPQETNQFEIIEYSTLSNGAIFQYPIVGNETTSISANLILKNSGIHALFFISPLYVIEDQIKFEGRCNNPVIDGIVTLNIGSNEGILSNENLDVLAKYFESRSYTEFISTPYYFRVEE